MAETSNSQEQRGEPVDSLPLRLDQLSDHELRVILQVERRLKAVQATASNSTRSRPLRPYLAPIERRHRRVLLLDGSRGTGKTSLLLTMAHRWNPRNASQETAHDADPEVYRKRVESIGETDFEIPKDILVPGRILDFDPLPPAVPLIAGIVQAWRPIAEKFDEELQGGRYDRQDEENGTLLDLWHSLFRVAAVGWTDLPPTQGIIEQVLDREEQVQDWHSLDTRWTRFLDQLIKSGQRYSSEEHRLSEDTVFVVMIDDVDLQVHRIRQLLPALRLLHHERVLFLVAADLEHMKHMLGADFYGQQNDLARRTGLGDASLAELIRKDTWSIELARSSVEKVFARRNRWKLERLSLLKLLAFPSEVSSLPISSDERTPETDHGGGVGSRPTSSTGATRNFLWFLKAYPEPGDGSPLHDVLLGFALRCEKYWVPGVVTYRTATQLHEHLERYGADESRRAQEALALLLSGTEAEHEAWVQSDGSVYLPIAGEVAALHRPGPTIPAVTHSFVLSARPDFVFTESVDGSVQRMLAKGDGLFNFAGALAAKMLEQRGFRVDASGLVWNTYLSHAWTEWFSSGLSFAWTRAFHPSPDSHLQQAAEWEEYVKLQIATSGDEKQVERWAYSWIFYQRQWCGHGSVSSLLHPTKSKDVEQLPWDKLCDVSDLNSNSDIRLWRQETLPLLARPELGFPLEVQRRLLSSIEDSDTDRKKALRQQRERLVTDAFVAGAIQRGQPLKELPSDARVKQTMEEIDKRYREGNEGVNFWQEVVGV